jgi:transcriptional regulator of acetoin/glycerol metabolism
MERSMTDTKTPTEAQVLDALGRTETVAQAARLLGISERTLYRRMDAFGIKRRVTFDRAA